MRWTAALVSACVLAACSRHAADHDPPQTPPPHEDRHEPATAPPVLSLAVTVAGATTTWSRAAFDAVPQMSGKARDGEARETWSLRDLVTKNAGAGARVVAVVGADGRKAIDPAQWTDATVTPILHTTRRGTLKFRWADATGKWGETMARDVTGLELAR